MSEENISDVCKDGENTQHMYTFFPFIKIEHDGSVLVDGQPSDQDIISQMNIESAKVLVLPYSKMVDQLEALEETDGDYQELIEEITDSTVEDTVTGSEESDISETMLHDHNYEDIGGRVDGNCYSYLLEPLDQSKNSCDLCQKTFNTPASLKRHVRIHTGERPFQCQICEKFFSQQSNLWKHVRTHTGERPFECPHCNKRFSQRANMKKHQVIHTGERPYVCYLCSRAFTQQANLSKHMRLHTGEKPYCCSYCDKRFTQRSNLQKHEHLHEGIKPYTCEVCFQAFTQQSNLKKHEMMHKNVRKFVCDICHKSYVQKVSLIKHRQRCVIEDRSVQYLTEISNDEYIVQDQEQLIKQYEAMEEQCLDFEDDIEEEIYDEDSSQIDSQETQLEDSQDDVLLEELQENVNHKTIIQVSHDVIHDNQNLIMNSEKTIFIDKISFANHLVVKKKNFNAV